MKKLDRPLARYDLTRKTFNYMYVIEFDHWHVQPNGRRKAMYRCRCLKCKTAKVVRGDSLTSGVIKSCGCVHQEIARKLGKKTGPKHLKFAWDAHRLPSGEATLNKLYAYCKCSATARNISFELPKRLWRKLVQRNCFYCQLRGHTTPPPFKHPAKGYNGGCHAHGLDRYDSSGPYHKDNVVPCCADHNVNKGTMHGDDYIKKLEEEKRHHGF